MTLELNLPRTPEPGDPKAAGPPRPILTADRGLAAGTGRATPLAEAGTPGITPAKPHWPTAPTSHPDYLPSEANAAQPPITRTASS